MPRLLLRLFAAAAVVGTVVGFVNPQRALAGPDVFVIEGGGFGHGVGMSQYGALGFAQQGWDYKAIISHYFTDTTVAPGTVSPEVRIQIGDDTSAPADLTLTPSAHVNIVLQGNVVATAQANEKIRAEVVGGKFNVTVNDTTVLNQVGGGGDNLYVQYNGSPIAVADTGRSYKYGQIELSAPSATQLRSTIANMNMNEYLRGLGEVPSSWPANALKAQVIAARSYAQFKLNNGATFLLSDVRDQNYVGYDKETGTNGAAWVAAVNDTGNELAIHGGSVIQAFYSSSSGGHTENSENVFVQTLPYLKGKPDPYDSANGQNPLHKWKRTWNRADMEKFVNSSSSTNVGTLDNIEFLDPLGVSGRVTKVIDGSRGGVRITGSGGVKRVNGTTFQSIINAAPGSGSNPLPSTLMRLVGTGPYGNFTGGVFVAAGRLNPGGGDVDHIVTGADRTGGPHVRVLNVAGEPTGAEWMAYDPRFAGGVRVAVCRFAGDDTTDSVVTAPGAGGGPHVRVFTATGTAQGGGFMAYEPRFTGGVYVGCGDIDLTNPGDEIITAPGAGGGPHVRVFDRDGGLRGDFMAYDPGFTGGVRVAGAPTLLVTAPGPGGGPHVRAFTLGGVELGGFMAYDPRFTGGVYVGAGNLSGDAGPEIVTGAGDPGGPHVRVFAVAGNEITGFMAFPTAGAHGARVAVAHVPGNAVVAGSGTGSPSALRVINL